MRIVIDLQGAQTTGSRNRGIGRYSTALARSIIRNRGDHEVLLALNGHFAESIDLVRADFADLLTPDQIHVWEGIDHTAQIDPANAPRRRAAELCRDAFLARLNPDVVHISSHFEGAGDGAISGIGRLNTRMPTSVTLYDLIPYIHQRPYLESSWTARWYMDRIDHLRRADLLLAISASSRREAIEYLNFPAHMVVEVGTAADPQFCEAKISPAEANTVLYRYGLTKPFLMYTGGIDYRKNIEQLIDAFAELDPDVRNAHQLAIVCSASELEKKRLATFARERGVSDMVMTGFVPEDDLIALYRLCALFVFPSWHEGFGLPALEAMWCGAPVLGSNRSSVPEVVGLEQALFDPHSITSIRDAIQRGLTDKAFRKRLLQHGKRHCKTFSWDKCGEKALRAMEGMRTRAAATTRPVLGQRPTLAFVSPIPPAPSGIAYYSAELLPELSRHYDITLVVQSDAARAATREENPGIIQPILTADEFGRSALRFDRILHHMGNSDHHAHQFELIRKFSGVVVQHDFYLSGVLNWLEESGCAETWSNALYRSHGYSALDSRFNRDGLATLIRYPCSIDLLAQARGVIVHSQSALAMANHWGGPNFARHWTEVPLLRVPAISPDRRAARAKLAIDPDTFLVCSFGIMHANKRNVDLVKAWLASPLVNSRSARLVFVGRGDQGEEGQEIERLIADAGLHDRITVSGWTDTATFRDYLAAADVGVQLRANSRGETSAAVLDCMNFGLATIVNANGSMAELADDVVLKLPDDFTITALSEALTKLWRQPDFRESLGQRGREMIRMRHSPRLCADSYFRAIETAYAQTDGGPHSLTGRIRAEVGGSLEFGDLRQLITAAARAVKPPARKVAHFDVSSLLAADGQQFAEVAVADRIASLFGADCELRIEPVYYDPAPPRWRYARRATLAALGLNLQSLPDEPVDFAHGDMIMRENHSDPDNLDYLRTVFALQLILLDRIERPSRTCESGGAIDTLSSRLAVGGWKIRPNDRAEQASRADRQRQVASL